MTCSFCASRLVGMSGRAAPSWIGSDRHEGHPRTPRNEECGESHDGAPRGNALELPEWLFRGAVKSDESGFLEIDTKRPAPCRIPADATCGQLIAAAGRHARRPAHIQLKVSAPGHQLVTQQLYVPGDPHDEDDIASAVRPELMLDPEPRTDGGEHEEVVHDYALPEEGQAKQYPTCGRGARGARERPRRPRSAGAFPCAEPADRARCRALPMPPLGPPEHPGSKNAQSACSCR
ncbi:dioxygenase family protein [Kocuria nitroreducens]|uniref:dioxygenase family protein n=1 Tax=Kocuria nitroreducens TaxID=3058914 RepID=UPI0036D8AC0D